MGQLAEFGLEEGYVDYLVTIMMRAAAMEKSLCFKRMLIDVLNFKKRIIGKEEFGKNLQLYKGKLKW